MEQSETKTPSDPLRLTPVCHGLGIVASVVFEPLTLGAYDAATWFAEPRQCYTLLGNATMAIGGIIIEAAGHPRRPAVFGAGSFDRFFRNALRSRSGESVLDRSISGILVPVVAVGSLLLTDIGVAGVKGYEDAVTRALPLLAVGIGGSTLGVAATQRGFGRERPYLKFADPPTSGGDTAHESFYSGHATTAFFSAAFADPVLADLLRTRWPDYSLTGDAPWRMRLLRLGQGVVLYGLAALVGYSRIDSDQHYMTDVLAGAFAGTVQGQLTYRWGYRTTPADSSVQVSAMPGAVGLTFSWTF